MKNIFKFITLGIALLAGTVAANAQTTWNKEGGVATAKNVSEPDENGLYTITLETYATGESSITETGIPVDIVLVLDVSGSMNNNMTSYTYTARDSQGYSYDNYPYTTLYYKHTDGEYYAVTCQRTGGYGNRRYNMHFTANNNVTYYLSGTGITTTNPNVSGSDTTIWTGVLYSRSSNTQSKMAALRSAVTAFVNEVHHNSLYDTKGKLRDTPLDNQISIVKFANDQYYSSESSIEEGNHRDASSDSEPGASGTNYNYTEVLKQFKDVSTDAGVNSLLQQSQGGVNAIVAGGATAAHYGLTKAKYLLDTVKDRESTKVVVFFTDGIPGLRGWDNNFANGAIDAAKDIKKATEDGGYGAIVYTVGVFDNLGTDATRATNYMNYVSSNYPEAESMSAPHTGSDQGYYQDASEADLTAIFKDIASSASQSDATVNASTQIRDVVSNSFILPEGASADDVTFYTMDITEDGNGWENQQTPAGVSASYKTTTGSDGVERKMLSVEGFDFTKDDIKDAEGFTTRENMGNFVGERYKPDGSTFWAGRKLVIEFKVQANGQATGGSGSATNHSDSGVYVYDPATDTYTNINHYPVPHTTLPMIIKIKKDGLRHGESATFEIHRCEPLKDDDGNILYNAIGKPRPDTDTDKNWSKVILTNKGADGDPVEKVLMALDPNYVYTIIEDDWAWSYTLSGTGTTLTTSEVEVNPFIFHNTEKEGVVKHAEAVSINHFATSAEGEATTEEYHSSKVKSF
ncbi:MAG: hypothetical protein IKM89_05350 [Bacteroidales bacterium]|nr:hypothetical protein [Bacteroidales bacterium]